jgi:hypothetical protein
MNNLLRGPVLRLSVSSDSQSPIQCCQFDARHHESSDREWKPGRHTDHVVCFHRDSYSCSCVAHYRKVHWIWV